MNDPNQKQTHRHVIRQQFTYQPPKDGQQARYVAIREKAHELASLLLDVAPASDDRDLAIQKLRECVMFANASISLEGVTHADCDGRGGPDVAIGPGPFVSEGMHTLLDVIVNGKKVTSLNAPVDATEAQVRMALSQDKRYLAAVQSCVEKKVMYVPGKVFAITVSGGSWGT